LQQLSEACPQLRELSITECTLEVGALMGLLPLATASDQSGTLELWMYNIWCTSLEAEVVDLCSQARRSLLLHYGATDKGCTVLKELMLAHPNPHVTLFDY